MYCIYNILGNIHCSKQSFVKQFIISYNGEWGQNPTIYLSIFNERKLVLGLQHVKVKVKVKVKVQTKKFRNIGVLPKSLDDLRYCSEHLDI